MIDVVLQDHLRRVAERGAHRGKLDQHLAEIDNACEERMELLTRQMSSQEGVTEALKAADQMEWVRCMNSIRNRVEEIVLHELVFVS